MKNNHGNTGTASEEALSDEALNAVSGGIEMCFRRRISRRGRMEQRKNIYLRQSYGHRQLSEMQEVRL